MNSTEWNEAVNIESIKSPDKQESVVPSSDGNENQIAIRCP